jgi:hypothetical protein
VPEWARTTITGFALLLPFAPTPRWLILTVSGEPAGRDFSAAEEASCAEVARHLRALNLDNLQLAIDRAALVIGDDVSAVVSRSGRADHVDGRSRNAMSPAVWGGPLAHCAVGELGSPSVVLLALVAGSCKTH